jgi:hypothetical protein
MTDLYSTPCLSATRSALSYHICMKPLVTLKHFGPHVHGPALTGRAHQTTIGGPDEGGPKPGVTAGAGETTCGAGLFGKFAWGSFKAGGSPGGT